ncbi:MAG: hypothetical protein EKK59_09640 [Neisseriaceae bacterium]|jgi:hypothetical protein|nr:MAG: hypothetical protein EKK59_09640 [Neisseriaceae bacterium]
MFTSYLLATAKRLLSSRCSQMAEPSGPGILLLAGLPHSHLAYRHQAKLSDVTTIEAAAAGGTKIMRAAM